MKEVVVALAILNAIIWSAVITRALSSRVSSVTVVHVPAPSREPVTICRGFDDVIEMPEVTITARPAARKLVLRHRKTWIPEAI